MKKLVSFMLVAAMVAATLTGCGVQIMQSQLRQLANQVPLQAQHLRLVVSAL